MVSLTAWTNSTTFGFSVNGSTENLRGVDIGAGDYVNFFVSIPISQWAGSGTTTLADRAVEEYAFNTSTSTTTSDTTSFGYGSQGWPIGDITAFLSRTVNWRTPVVSTDTIILEISADRIIWKPVPGGANGQIIDSLRYDGTNFIGMGIDAGSGYTAVYFGRYRTGTNVLWTGGAANIYWRVRKVSSGAQVGYPISTKNIVGATDGVAPVTGMLGEKIDLTARAVTTASAQWRANTTPLATLSSGIYLIYGVAGLPGGSGSASVSVMSTNNNNDGTGFISNYTTSNYQSSAAGGAVPMITAHLVVPSGTTQAIYAKAYGDVSTPVVTISGFAVRIA